MFFFFTKERILLIQIRIYKYLIKFAKNPKGRNSIKVNSIMNWLKAYTFDNTIMTIIAMTQFF